MGSRCFRRERAEVRMGSTYHSYGRLWCKTALPRTSLMNAASLVVVVHDNYSDWKLHLLISAHYVHDLKHRFMFTRNSQMRPPTQMTVKDAD
eukprot:5413353-Amphidinium_carterae.1